MPLARALFALAAALSCASTLSCAGDAAQGDDGDDGVDLASIEDQLSADTAENSSASGQSFSLGRVFLMPLDKATARDEVKRVDRFKALRGDRLGFFPFSCATSTRIDEHRARVSLDRCIGAFGMAQVSGDLEAVFGRSPAGGDMRVEVNDLGNLKVNGAAATYKARIDASFGDSERSVTWTTSWSGLTRRGKHVDHTSTLHVVTDAGSKCAEISGTTRGKVDARELETTIDSYRVCPASCPERGVISSVARPSGKTVLVRYDGSGKARVSTPRGEERLVALSCDTDETP